MSKIGIVLLGLVVFGLLLVAAFIRVNMNTLYYERCLDACSEIEGVLDCKSICANATKTDDISAWIVNQTEEVWNVTSKVEKM